MSAKLFIYGEQDELLAALDVSVRGECPTDEIWTEAIGKAARAGKAKTYTVTLCGLAVSRGAIGDGTFNLSSDMLKPGVALICSGWIRSPYYDA